MEQQDSAEQLKRKVDFEKRKQAAVQEMDAVLQKYEVGFALVLGGMPQAIRPVISYQDIKQWDKPVEEKAETKKTVKKDGKKTK